MTLDRRAAEARGRRGEGLAALALRLKGYRILARRVRSPVGEIDLIAMHRRTLVFAEVKARATPELAIEAVTPRARRRIERAAQIWAGQNHHFSAYGHRFDIVAVCPWRWPVHVRDAWRPDFAVTGY